MKKTTAWLLASLGFIGGILIGFCCSPIKRGIYVAGRDLMVDGKPKKFAGGHSCCDPKDE